MWFYNLFMGTGVAHSVLLIALTIAFGLALSRVKIAGISLGVTWVLFVGILASHFGLVLDPETSHFVKEFGLILFIYSIGMQVGPGFFSSFKQGGVSLNILATSLVLLGSITAFVIHVITGESLEAMIGVLYGAVTNTPGLGAAQQTFSDMNNGETNSIFAQGYAVAYPLGVVGIILSIILTRYIFKINFEKEQELYNKNNFSEDSQVRGVTLTVTNEAVAGRTIKELHELAGKKVVTTRLMHRQFYIVAKPADIETYKVLLGTDHSDADNAMLEGEEKNSLVSERLIVTNTSLQGKRLSDLDLNNTFHVNISRVRRSGIDIVAHSSVVLQIGDRLTVVGTQDNVNKVEKLLGNSVKRLDEPQLFTIFIGIALGVLLGSLPIFFPGMPVPVKLGLAGGPLIVSILVSCYGPKFHLVTYSTTSANLLMREIGTCLFMASVGLGAGVGFVDTVLHGGYWWVLYGFIITFLPCMVVAVMARLVFHKSYFTIAGMISGATTDPPALAYSNSICGNDQASIAYSTVYPLTMFLRVLVAQILVLLAL